MSEEFLKQVVKNIEIALSGCSLPDPPPSVDPPFKTIPVWQISSPNHASLYLGIDDTDTANIHFRSFPVTIHPPTLIHWNFVDSSQQPFYGAFLSKAGEYYWQYVPSEDRIVVEPTYGDPSFALKLSNIFHVNGANNPYTVSPYLAPSQYIEYNPSLDYLIYLCLPHFINTL